MEVFRLVGRIVTEGLDKTEDQLGTLGKRFDDVAKKAGNFGKRAQEVGAGMSAVGVAATAKVTAPLAAMGAAAIGAADQTQQATGRLQAQLGLTAAEAEKMAGVAQRVWAQGFGENVGAAADAVALVGQNMRGLDPSQIEEATRHALTFQQAFGEDVQASTRTANTLMKQFGISSAEAFDLMTVGAQRGGNLSGDLLDTLNEYAPQFKALGYSAEGFTATLIAGAESGAFSLDKLADSAKESFLQIGDGSKENVDALNAIGLNAEQVMGDIASGGDKAQSAFMAVTTAISAVEDPAERSRLSIALMGTPLEDMGPEFQTFFQNVNQNLDGVSGSANAAGDALQNNFSSRLTNALRQAGIAFQPLGLALMDLAERALPVVEQKIEQLANWFGSLTAGQQKWIVILAASAAAAGPLLVVLGTLTSSIGTLITAAAAFTRVATRIGSSMNLISKAGTLLRSGLSLLKGGFGMIVTAAKGVGVALRFLALTPVGLVITAITALVAIGIYLYKNWDTLGPKIIAIWNKVKTGTVNIFNSLWAFFQSIFSTIGNFISRTASNIVNGLIQKWNSARSKTMQVFNAIASFMRSIFTGIYNFVTSSVRNLINGMINFWNSGRSRLNAIVSGLRDFIVNTFNSMRTRVIQIAQNIVNGVVNGWNSLRDRTTTVFNDLKTKLTGKLTEIATEAGKIPGKIGSAITNKVKDATESMADLASSLVKKFKSALGINSPSTVFEGFGWNIVEGLVNGLGGADLKSFGLEMFGDFAGGALNSLKSIKDFFTGGFTGGGAGASAAAAWVRQAMAIVGVPESWFGPLMTTAKKESGFNPRAINLWDSNYLAGIPSKGLFQTIDPTFNAHKMPGLNDIYNPIHNAVAAIRYMQSRYGSVFNIPGIRAMMSGGAYKGYEKGGVFTGPSVIRVAETNRTPVEAAIPLSGRYMFPFADAIGSRIAEQGGNNEGGTMRLVVEVPVMIDGKEFARVVTPDIDAQMEANRQRNLRATGKRG